MIRRPFYAMLGLGAGVALGVLAMRKLDAVQRSLRPDSLARSAGARASSLRERIGEVVQEARAIAAEKEAELRGVYSPAGHAPSPNGEAGG